MLSFPRGEIVKVFYNSVQRNFSKESVYSNEHLYKQENGWSRATTKSKKSPKTCSKQSEYESERMKAFSDIIYKRMPTKKITFYALEEPYQEDALESQAPERKLWAMLKLYKRFLKLKTF